MRFIDLGIVSPAYSVCVDRAMFHMHSDGLIDNTLYIYRRDRPSISLGRFRDEASDVDLKKITEDSLDVVRRVSGGSSIYSDEGQITYAVVMDRSDLPSRREDSFEYICRVIIASLELLGIRSEYKPVNDILVNNRKISGSAQHRNARTVLQHGSLIVDTPQSSIDTYLKAKKRSYDGTTSMKDILGRMPDHDAIVSSLLNGFSEIFGRIDIGTLGADELEMIGKEMDKSINHHAVP